MSDFLRSLYEQHLEEAAFLYAQRLTLFDDIEATWLRIGEFEDRLDAQIDALVTGGEDALAFCRQNLQAGGFDPGGLYTTICLCCRLGRKDLTQDWLHRCDPESADFMLAINEALNHSMPAEWVTDILALSEAHPPVTDILVRLAGHRRLPLGSQLINLLNRKDPGNVAEIIWALGRLNYQDARPILIAAYLKDQDESTAISSSLALLRLGEPTAISHCSQFAASQDWPNVLLGIGAGHSAVPVLLNKAYQDRPSPNCLIGLGLLGDIAAIEPFLKHLADPQLSESAALGLNLITGAELYEEVFVPDEAEEDELFPAEVENFRQGRLPARSDGKPFGANITRLSRNGETWRVWWSQNRARFNPAVRYRSGKPLGPKSLLENLMYYKTPYKLRQLAYEELVIRYGQDFPFEADMLVTRQQQVLADISRWVSTEGTRFKEGIWYFAGQPLS